MLKGSVIRVVTVLTLIFFICFCLPTNSIFGKDKAKDILLKAKTLIQQGDFDEAIKELNRVIDTLKYIASKTKKAAEAYYLLAKLYYIGGMQSDFEYNIKLMYKTYPEYVIEEKYLDLREKAEKIKEEEAKKQEREKIIVKQGKKKKKKKFPVLLVGLGVTAIGILIILLLKKKPKPESGDNPPSVSITSPSEGVTVSGTVNVAANASDDKGISKVEFYIDDSLVSTDISSPYEFDWNTSSSSNGSHTIKAKAYDTINQTTEHQITVTVNNASSTPVINRSPSSLEPNCCVGTNAGNQTFTIRNSGEGTLNYSINDNASWLSCSPTNGTSIAETDTISVHYNTSGLNAGTHNAIITISASGATNSPQTISVVLTVSSKPSIPASITYKQDVLEGVPFSISWSSVSNATKYELQRATVDTFADAVKVYEDSSTSWTQSGLSADSYFYRVRAKNSCGTSGWREGGEIEVD